MQMRHTAQHDESQTDQQQFFAKFVALQKYVDWSVDDQKHLQTVSEPLCSALPGLVETFYDSVLNCEQTKKTMRGGNDQVERLKKGLHKSLQELITGPYDSAYVARRWRIGQRHLQVGLDEAFVCAAVANLRQGMLDVVATATDNAAQPARSLNKLLDLDLAVIQDAYATQRLQLERVTARQQSEQQFRTLVESAAVVVLILDPDGQVAYFSPYGEALTGFVAEDVVGQSFAAILANESQKSELGELIDEALASGAVRDRELDVKCADRSRRRWLCNMTRLTDYDGERALLLVAHDTTKWRAAQDRLLRSERLAGIGTMVAGLAHESRNALQRIGSMAEMLELELEGNDSALALIHRLQTAQDDLRRLFDEVRNYAAPLQLEFDYCSLAGCWHEAWQLVKSSRSGRRAQLIEQVEATNSAAKVDRFRLVQVLRNLLENALMACPDPAVITVKLRDVKGIDNDAVELCVMDNGPGIAVERRLQIFEPFYTTHTKGTGLGLAIARRIVDAHGGTIVADESPDGGAAFIITLPRVGEMP